MPVSARQRIEAITLDMSSTFDLVVRAQSPKAVVVYDRSYVEAKYGFLRGWLVCYTPAAFRSPDKK
ncbi:transposase [Halomonas salipaludis]|uniref:transposase n=1 Tax=Halomonas salipaludis TaxID=2032625 RepID=UPI001140BCEA